MTHCKTHTTQPISIEQTGNSYGKVCWVCNTEIAVLKAKIREVEAEWRNFHASNTVTCYSYPVHQVKELKRKIAELETNVNV